MRGAEIAAISALLGRSPEPQIVWHQAEETAEEDAGVAAIRAPHIHVYSGFHVDVSPVGLDTTIVGCVPDVSIVRSLKWTSSDFRTRVVRNADLGNLFVPIIADLCGAHQQQEFFGSELEQLIINLGRLQAGWAGPGTLPPSQAALRDLDAALVALDGIRICPQAEVDSSDGAVTLIWDKPNESFSLVFNGNSRVIGVLSPYRPEYPAWDLPADDDSGLSEKIESLELLDFIGA